MNALLAGLLSFGKRGGERAVDYETAKVRAASPDVSERRSIAGQPNVRPEILYFLAEDSDASVRRTIAANPSTPIQADALLSADADEDVRCLVAEKVARLAPGLSPEQRAKAGDVVTGILIRLAGDQAVRVRRALAEELKGAKDVPAEVVERLARDGNAAVSVPVLRHSPLLADGFLIELIASGPVTEALEAIASRETLGADVADAVVATGETGVIAALLSNRGAHIREETLDRLVEGAADVEAWHAPLVARPALSQAAAKTLSRYVAEDLLERLLDREDLDPATIEAIGNGVRRRLGADGEDAAETGDRETAEERVSRLHRSGALSEDEIRSAMMRGERSFVIEAIAVLGGLKRAVVQKAFTLASAKGVAAVSWRAGLSAEIAHELQLRLARVAPKDALRPSGGGYALDEKDLNWQLEFLGA